VTKGDLADRRLVLLAVIDEPNRKPDARPQDHIGSQCKVAYVGPRQPRPGAQRISLAAAGLTFVLLTAQPAAAEDPATQLVGVWKLTGFQSKEVATGTITHPFGERPLGYYVYTKGGRFVIMHVAQDRKKPGPNPTDTERAELLKSMAATAGTYKVEWPTIPACRRGGALRTCTATRGPAN
jgi:hypothetical protein